MHELSNSVGLLSSSRDTALHLRDEELRYEPRKTTVQQNRSNPHLLTLVSGRFRVGFGLGDISNMIEH